MVRVCRNNKESVLAMVRKGKLDAAALSTSNLVDEIILSMNKHGVLDCLNAGIPDRRGHNKTVSFELIWASAIAAKMKIHSSLSDIPFAITDHRTLAELGYSLYDPDGTYNGLMRESGLRFLESTPDMSWLVPIAVQFNSKFSRNLMWLLIFILWIVHHWK